MLKRGVREQPDVSAIASLDQNKLAVLVWHYHDDDISGPDAEISLAIHGLPDGDMKLKRYAIDSDHSNAFEAWRKMGSPLQPTPEQMSQLEKAGQLAEVGLVQAIQAKDGTLRLNLRLPSQAVTLVILDFGGH